MSQSALMSETATTPQPGMRLTAALIAGFGLLTILAALPALNLPLAFLLDLLFWPLGDAPVIDTRLHRLLFAITGGITLGWGAMVWMLAAVPGAAVRRAVILGCGVWFACDSLFSVVAGVPQNVLGNALFLAAVLWPLRR